MKAEKRQLPVLEKAPTGISGLDEITGGGLPKGRPTLICGSAGCGKTMLAMEFLVRGATEFGEPGVFVTFEERTPELIANFASLGYDLNALIAENKIRLDYVHIERSEIEETGDYDLEGLFIRLGYPIDEIGARRVALDTIESLFSGFNHEAILRAELRRLFRWLKDKGVTAIVTGERGEKSLTRHGLEEYVADCVILLDHRVDGEIATRRVRVVKYRGSSHGTSEYPFLIDEGGVSILPLTSLGLKHTVSSERVSTGVPSLDAMMGEKGYFRGSSVLISGTAGTGKSSLAAHYTVAAAARGERTLWFSFEESPSQIERNMRSIGLEMEPALKKNLLYIHSERPSVCGLEMHLVTIHKLIRAFDPQNVIFDPLTSFTSLGSGNEIKAMLTRLIDFLKLRRITGLFTSLMTGGNPLENTDVGISSVMDTWILLRDVENGGERNRVLNLIKSRGMAHSNQVREFLLTDRGIELQEVYLGQSGALILGSGRTVIEAQERFETLVREQEIKSKKRAIELKSKILEAQIASLRAGFKDEQTRILRSIEQDDIRTEMMATTRSRLESDRKNEDRSLSKKTPPRQNGRQKS